MVRRLLMPTLAALLAAGRHRRGRGRSAPDDAPHPLGGAQGLRGRALGRPALQHPAGDGRRAEPDRRHERPEAGVHRPRRRPEERLGPVRRQRLHAGPRVPEQPEGAGRVHARRQRLDGLRPAGRRELARATRPRAGAVLLDAVHPGPAPAPPAGAGDAAVPLRRRPGAVRREPPLDVPRRRVRDAQRPGLLQQPLRRRPRPGRVRGPERGQHRLAEGHVRAREAQARGGRDADRAGRSRLRRLRRHARAAARPEDPGRDGRPARRLRRVPERGARRDDRVPPPGRLRPRRLALLPPRQAAPERRRRSRRELHARRDVRRQPAERNQRRELAEGLDRPALARGLQPTSRRSCRATAPRYPPRRPPTPGPAAAGPGVMRRGRRPPARRAAARPPRRRARRRRRPAGSPPGARPGRRGPRRSRAAAAGAAGSTPRRR